MLDIGQIATCLVNAEKRIDEAAYNFQRILFVGGASDDHKRACRADMLICEQEARDFYAAATAYGWTGDAEAEIAKHWQTYLPEASPDLLDKLRAKAREETARSN